MGDKVVGRGRFPSKLEVAAAAGHFLDKKKLKPKAGSWEMNVLGPGSDKNDEVN